MADPLRTGAIFRVTDLSKLRSVAPLPRCRRETEGEEVEPITTRESHNIATEFTDLLATAKAPNLTPKRRRAQPRTTTTTTTEAVETPETPPTVARRPQQQQQQQQQQQRRQRPSSQRKRRAPSQQPRQSPTPVKTTRSGRRSCRVLEWWKSERLVVSSDGSAAIVSTEDDLPGHERPPSSAEDD
ncbi:hypothetical protein CTAYLR_002946 [Chrysophaeum taylorii]|uniref:Uncharacterized protein n=1 Tax=Chrysophaeum taylorii TaxID=2483200 RepID=A0AAD7UM51_9STRA|nr:hypothetical protein CTAYLR_002946 [Chrysophaeum taylorii]